jgi:hypothetical protein
MREILENVGMGFGALCIVVAAVQLARVIIGMHRESRRTDGPVH